MECVFALNSFELLITFLLCSLISFWTSSIFMKTCLFFSCSSSTVFYKLLKLARPSLTLLLIPTPILSKSFGFVFVSSSWESFRLSFGNSNLRLSGNVILYDFFMRTSGLSIKLLIPDFC